MRRKQICVSKYIKKKYWKLKNWKKLKNKYYIEKKEKRTWNKRLKIKKKKNFKILIKGVEKKGYQLFGEHTYMFVYRKARYIYIYIYVSIYIM